MNELDFLKEILEGVKDLPTIESMPRKTLKDKGIYGPTSAHFIEEIHTPLNYHYITTTTGTSAYQNLVGVLKSEIDDRIAVGEKALMRVGIEKGDKLLVTYPPLVNVFSKEALDSYGVTWEFLLKSSRDALIYSICTGGFKCIIGESTFLKAMIVDAKRSGLIKYFPEELIIITAGTALDLDLLEVLKDYPNYSVHDLYGAQEFGWLTLDGVPLREDISLVYEDSESAHLIVGGIPTGDKFKISERGHVCNSEGKIITYSKIRTPLEFECVIKKSKVSDRSTLERLIKTILRIKGKIVRIDEDIELSKSENKVYLKYYNSSEKYEVEGSLRYLESIIDGQLNYQSQSKKDPVWTKRS